MSNEQRLTVLVTCHDRCRKTKECLYSLDDPGMDMNYIAVDDGCTDGTRDMLQEFRADRNRTVDIISGDGTLFWAGGMRLAMEKCMRDEPMPDHLLLINDDVVFFDKAPEKMLKCSMEHGGVCVAGAVCDTDGRRSYGGVRYDMRRVKSKVIDIGDEDLKCDAANMNAFLLTRDAFLATGVFDSHYVHSMADFDHCFELRRNGFEIYMTDEYVGKCEKNVSRWNDTGLSRLERLRLKESPKGLPRKEWFYYLKKNFGTGAAVWHSLTPYIRIIAGR